MGDRPPSESTLEFTLAVEGAATRFRLVERGLDRYYWALNDEGWGAYVARLVERIGALSC